MLPVHLKMTFGVLGFVVRRGFLCPVFLELLGVLVHDACLPVVTWVLFLHKYVFLIFTF